MSSPNKLRNIMGILLCSVTSIGISAYAQIKTDRLSLDEAYILEEILQLEQNGDFSCSQDTTSSEICLFNSFEKRTSSSPLHPSDFLDLDKNDDSKISQKEFLNHQKAIFSELDLNSDGQLKLNEIIQHLETPFPTLDYSFEILPEMAKHSDHSTQLPANQ